jgi:hypothetical protein
MRMEKQMNILVSKLKFIIVIILTFVFSAFQNEEENYPADCQITFDKFIKEVRSYVDSVRNESVHNGNYNVYLAKFTDDEKFECCVTLEYIFTNQDTSKLEAFNYFALIDGSLVIMNFTKDFRDKYDLQDDRINHIVDKKFIIKRLLNEVFFGEGTVLVSCFRDYETSRTYYQDDSHVPGMKRIFENKRHGSVRVVDSTEFKMRNK